MLPLESLTEPACVAAAHVSFGSPASFAQEQPCDAGPGGNASQPGSHWPTLQTPFWQPHDACGGGGPWSEQRSFGSPSSTASLQLSSLALHVSFLGVLASQPSNLPFAPLHVS